MKYKIGYDPDDWHRPTIGGIGYVGLWHKFKRCLKPCASYLYNSFIKGRGLLWVCAVALWTVAYIFSGIAGFFYGFPQ